MAIDLKLIDKLLADYKKPEDIIGENGLLKQLTKALLERAMQAEMTDHLGYEKHDPAGNNSGNSRNGATTKTLKGDFGELPLETPRDRNGTYEPKIIGKGQTRFTGFDDKIVSMYARGMSTREIQGHLEEDLQSRGEPDADFQRDRGGNGGGQELAEPAAGRGVPHCLPGCVGREGSRIRACTQ
jgi:putative transposase